MGFKHSPAPWHLRDGINEGSLLLDDNYNVVALLSTEIKREDENLIEAAPELLEALRELIQTHEYSLRIGYERIIELGDDCDSPEIMITKDSSLNKAKAAIEKALGQQ